MILFLFGTEGGCSGLLGVGRVFLRLAFDRRSVLHARDVRGVDPSLIEVDEENEICGHQRHNIANANHSKKEVDRWSVIETVNQKGTERKKETHRHERQRDDGGLAFR